MLSILVFFSSILKKGFAAGILTLLSVYLLSAVGPLFRIEKYLPSNLMKIATSIGSTVNTDIIISLFCTVVLIVFMNAFSVMWLKRVELV
jgi:hypothetical protein